jgi:hypothetical protein
MHKSLKLLAAALFLTLGISFSNASGQTDGNNEKPARNEAPEELSLDEILENHYKAIGGEVAWKAVETLKFTGSMYTKEATFKTAGIYKRPNICRIDYQAGALYFMEAYDGKIAWQMNPGTRTGPQLLEGKRAKEMIDTCDFEGLLVNHRKKGHKIKYLGAEQIEDRGAYVLEVTSNAGNTDKYYLDSKTFLPFMVKGKTEIQDQVVETTIMIDEYIEIGEITIPFSYEFIVDGNPSTETLKIKTIELNDEFDDTIFSPPKMRRNLR